MHNTRRQMRVAAWIIKLECTRLVEAPKRRKAFQHQTVACSFRLKSIVILSLKANLNAIGCKFAKQPIMGKLADNESIKPTKSLKSRPSINIQLLRI